MPRKTLRQILVYLLRPSIAGCLGRHGRSDMQKSSLAPEGVDHRADIFSLGVVIYEALCGKAPFEGKVIMDTVTKIVGLQEPRLDTIVPTITPQTAAVIAKSMAKNP